MKPLRGEKVKQGCRGEYSLRPEENTEKNQHKKPKTRKKASTKRKSTKEILKVARRHSKWFKILAAERIWYLRK